MTRYSNTMREILFSIREGYSPKEIKMAIGIAADKRYKQGNYDGAVDAIEKIKKGLSDHPQVKAVLKRLNTDFDPEIAEEKDMSEMCCKNCGDSFGQPTSENNCTYDAYDPMGENWIKKENYSEEVEIDEMKMDDPKLVKAFDKMKKGDTIKLKTSSTINKGKDFVDYVVKAKNVVNKGRVEKITLVTKGNEGAVKKFLYKRDGKVTFAIGDMGASIDDIKEGTWALPDSPKAKDALKKLMSKPIKLGKEGDDASDKLYALIGDDELFDDLYDAGKKNPNGDARPVISKWMKKNFTGSWSKYAIEEVELEEGKSSTGYELYHKDFSSAMAHAYDFAKKKFDIEVDPKEIDDKVASGPRKPAKGKTNSYRLKGKDGKKAIQVQVYGMDNGKYELNMYKESVELEEKLKVSDGLGAWIDDFKKSDAPQFQGKSDEEKKNMAIAAFTDAGGKLDEMREPYAVIDTADGNKVVGTASDEKGAKSIITSAELPPMKIKDKKTLKIVKVKKKQMIGQPIKEEEEPQKPDSAKAVDQMRDDKKKTRIAQLQLQIAKAQETINKLNAQEKPSE